MRRVLLLPAAALLLAACTTGQAGAPVTTASAPGTTHGHDSSVSLTPAQPLAAGETLLALSLPRPYQPVATNGAKDDYRCFLLDPGVTSQRFITGVRFLPGNPDVVHHAIAYRVEPDQVAAAQQLDARDAQDGWQCFGGPGLRGTGNDGAGLSSAPWLAAWAPGGRETRFPAKTGVRITPGEQVVLQVHYNLRAGDGLDQTGVDFRTVAPSDEMTALETMLLPAPVELPCAAGESGPLCDRDASIQDTINRFGADSMKTIWGLQLLCGGSFTDPKASATQTCTTRVAEDSTIYAAAGHMHLLGKSITIDLNPGTAEARRILDIPVYDFDEQGSKFLPEPLKVTAGDVLRVTCTHDTSLRAQLPALQGEEPRYITWGEGTTDEMCLGVVTFARDR